MATAILLLVLSLALLLAGSEGFTNGVEWLGKRFNLAQGVVGSVLAAVGTALPETLIPIIAVVAGAKVAGADIATGAIVGAPFMLATLAFFVVAIATLAFHRINGRSTRLDLSHSAISKDLRYFLLIYPLALGATFVESYALKAALAVVLIGIYAWFVWRHVADGDGHMGDDDIAHLYFHPKAEHPALALITFQVAASLGLIIFGAHLFVDQLHVIGTALHAPPQVLATLIAPIATELPEKFNSVIWIRRGRDTLALGNITGAMVFQSVIPVSVGLLLTPWHMDLSSRIVSVVALASAGVTLMLIRRDGMHIGGILHGGLFYICTVAWLIAYVL